MQQLLRRWRGGSALSLLLRAAPSGAKGCNLAAEQLLGGALAEQGGPGALLGGQALPSSSLCRWALRSRYGSPSVRAQQ